MPQEKFERLYRMTPNKIARIREIARQQREKVEKPAATYDPAGNIPDYPRPRGVFRRRLERKLVKKDRRHHLARKDARKYHEQAVKLPVGEERFRLLEWSRNALMDKKVRERLAKKVIDKAIKRRLLKR